MSRDKRTTYSVEQGITTDVVSDFVNSFPTDEARNVFFGRPNLIKARVTEAFTDLDEGLRIEFRFDTQADLNSGNQIVIGDSGILLPAVLLLNKLIQFRLQARKLPAGYDFCGIYYNVVTTAATLGEFTTYLSDGPEDADSLE